MNKVCLSITGIALLFIGATAQAETIPEQVDINLQKSNPVLAEQWKDKKEVKGFSHLTHTEILKKMTPEQDVCLTCHKEVQTSSEIVADNRKEKQQGVVVKAGGIKKYMHGQCVICHKTLKKQKAVTGPTSCKGCH